MTRSGINPKTSRSGVERFTTALHVYAFLLVTKCIINLYKNTLPHIGGYVYPMSFLSVTKYISLQSCSSANNRATCSITDCHRIFAPTSWRKDVIRLAQITIFKTGKAKHVWCVQTLNRLYILRFCYDQQAYEQWFHHNESNRKYDWI